MARKKSETPADHEQIAYQAGLTGTVEQFYALLRPADEDHEAKLAAYVASSRKYSNKLFYSYGRYKKFEDAFDKVKDVPSRIRQEFYRGACEAFLNDRPDNIRFILSNPKGFNDYNETPVNFVSRTLIELMDKSDNPATVPGNALAGIPKEERRDILGNALWYTLSRNPANENFVSDLLRVGAKADYNSSQSLYAAVQSNSPMEIINMLFENGATFKSARNHRNDVSRNDVVKLDLVQYKIEAEETIRQLRETIAELTHGRSPAKAATLSGKYAELKITSARPG